MSRAIDVMHLGREKVICAYEVDGFVVDPGPASAAATLLEGLSAEPKGLLLTHIHLDHAGATGVLCRRFPGLRVYVHERGAPHVIDPSKLLASAGRLYGDDMERLWGEVAPVDEARVTVLKGGESVEGFDVAYTPGHASHHVSYYHRDSGDAYVGDTAGVRIPPGTFVQAPTPPPDIDVETWLDSIERIAAWNPQRLCLTHFGPVTEVEDHLHALRTRLLDNAELARDLDKEGFTEAMKDLVRQADGDAVLGTFGQAAPFDHLYDGLQRYWRKRAEADAA